jgi:hypothetical protein
MLDSLSKEIQQQDTKEAFMSVVMTQLTARHPSKVQGRRNTSVTTDPAGTTRPITGTKKEVFY